MKSKDVKNLPQKKDRYVVAPCFGGEMMYDAEVFEDGWIDPEAEVTVVTRDKKEKPEAKGESARAN